MERLWLHHKEMHAESSQLYKDLWSRYTKNRITVFSTRQKLIYDRDNGRKQLFPFETRVHG